jgi:ankyrin repeat protein
MKLPFELFSKVGSFLGFKDFTRLKTATRLLNLKFTGQGLSTSALIREIDHIYSILDADCPDHQGFELIYDLFRFNRTETLISYALRTWLFKAVESSNYKLLELLFLYNADPNARSSSYDFSYSNLLQLSKSVRMARYLLKKGADPALPGLTVGSDSLTPLHTVTNFDIAKLLISNGANVNQRSQRGFVPLHTVANVEIAKLLVSHGADITTRSLYNLTPLHESRNAEIASYFLSLGADPNALSTTNESCLAKGLDEQISRLLLENGANVHLRDDEGCTALHHCKTLGQVRVLLGAGADINALNSNNASPLLYILQHCPNVSLEMIEELVECGSDVSVRDHNGFTAMRLAKSYEMCLLFINYGADILVTDVWSMNCLYGVKSVQHAELLVRYGLDPVTSKDCSGRTPLHCCQTVPVAEYFLSLGAEVNALDNYGNTPIQEIQEWGRSETKGMVITYLLSKGGGPPKPVALLKRVYSTGVFD